MNAPSSIDEVVNALATSGAELRAGGTDIIARYGCGRATGPFVDLSGLPGLRGVTWRADGTARIGATTTVAEIADDDRLRAAYPALTAVAASLATPQIRTAGTVGGNLLQRNRCWYYRNPHFSCYQTGGETCPARTGVNLYSVVIDKSPCIAPHPSSLAMALLAYDATLDVHARGTLAIGDLYGDGSDPTRDHLLADREVLLAVDLPVPVGGEQSAYQRVTGRAGAEWPLVEVAARLTLSDTTITFAAVAVSGVARTPLRLTEVESALVGQQATPQTLQAASARAAPRCTPLPQTRYKVDLLRDAILDAIERAAAPR